MQCEREGNESETNALPTTCVRERETVSERERWKGTQRSNMKTAPSSSLIHTTQLHISLHSLLMSENTHKSRNTSTSPM